VNIRDECINVLRNADRPMSTPEIAKAIYGSDYFLHSDEWKSNRIHRVYARLHSECRWGNVVKITTRQGVPTYWRLTE
jgi:hypothetical protein